MKALVVAPGAPGNIELADVDEPSPAPDEALVAVRAVSLNRGEVRNLARAAPGARPGWDVAGEVLEAAADGTGPDPGARVVALLRAGGGWAERAAVRTTWLAPIPDELSFTEAATLPVAGLTAQRTLHEAGVTTDHRVLITGAAGGVGRFAIQLAAHEGAEVWGVVGHEDRGRGLAELGAHRVVVGMPEPDGDAGPFDIILESVGGRSLSCALGLVAHHGTVVTFGSSSGEPTTFDVTGFYRRSGAKLLAFVVFEEVERLQSCSLELAQLAGLVATGRLVTSIAAELSWRDAAEAIAALLERRVDGKVVLTID